MKQRKDGIWAINAIAAGHTDYDFYETDDGKYGIYFSNISQSDEGRQVSPVQIWTNRQHPRMLYQSKKMQFDWQPQRCCYYLEKSDIIALLTPCDHGNGSELLYVLLDFNKRKFAVVQAENFDLQEIAQGEVQLVLHFRKDYDEKTRDKISQQNGETIYLNEYAWYTIERLDKVCVLIYG